MLTSFQSDPHVGYYNNVPAVGTVLPNPYGTVSRSTYLGDPSFNTLEREQASIGYAFEHRFDENWLIRQNFRFFHVDGTVQQLLPLALEPDLRTLDRYSIDERENINTVTVDTNVQGKVYTGPLAHTVLAEVDYQHLIDDNLLQLGFAPSIDIFNPVYSPFTPSTVERTRTNQAMDQLGVYAQDQIKLDRWIVTPGGREDFVKTTTLADDTFAGRSNVEFSDQAFSWRAGLTYLLPNGIAPYVSAETSFQPIAGTTFSGSPFTPTTGQQFEGGVKYQPPGYKSLFTVAVYDLTEQNVLTPDPNPAHAGFLVQTGEVHSDGVELEAKVSVTDQFDMIASYAYTNAIVTQTTTPGELGKHPVNIPDQTAALWGFYTFRSGSLDGFGIGGGIRYVGELAGDELNSFFVPNYALVDAAFRYDLEKASPQFHGMVLNLNITNLFDTTYVSQCASDVNCVYGVGRTIIAGLKYRW